MNIKKAKKKTQQVIEFSVTLQKKKMHNTTISNKR